MVEATCWESSVTRILSYIKITRYANFKSEVSVTIVSILDLRQADLLMHKKFKYNIRNNVLHTMGN